MKTLFLMITVLLMTLTSCEQQEQLGKGNHILAKEDTIIRVHCKEDGCPNKTEWIFTKSEAVDALRNRFEFEYMNAVKVKDSTHADAGLEILISYFDKMRSADLEQILSNEMKNNFKDRKLFGYLFAATDSIIFERKSKK